MKKQFRKSFVIILTMEYQNVHASVKGQGCFLACAIDQYFLTVPEKHTVIETVNLFPTKLKNVWIMLL
jgi:hypothetical protein